MRPAALLASALAACTPAAHAGGPWLELDAKVVWQEPGERFGGFSGLVVEDGGTRFLTISDRGSWATGSFERSDGQLRAAHLDDIGPLHEISGAPVGGINFDAEGLARDAEGGAWVSFEGFHRVRRYDRIDGPAAPEPSHPDFPRLQFNSGLEALAIAADDTVYAIPERSGRLDRPFPVYRLRDGHWDKPWQVRRDGSFLVSDADFGPEGDLYLVEREFSWLGGFRTRVRRFTPGPEGLGDEVTLLETNRGELDNMEGISVWRDAAGATRVTLISDDNFFPLQQTIFAEYVLVGG